MPEYGFRARRLRSPRQRFLDQFDRNKGCVSVEYGMTYRIRGGNECSAAYHDLNTALVAAIADMLPVLRERARQRAVEAARNELKAAEEKLAKLVTQSG